MLPLLLLLLLLLTGLELLLAEYAILVDIKLLEHISVLLRRLFAQLHEIQ